MTLDGLAIALLVGAMIVLVSVVGVRLAGRLGVPGLLLYLLLGLVLSTAFPGLAVEDAQLATVLGYSALVLILAQGGLTTRLDQLRTVMWPSLTLASVGVAVSIAVVSVPLVLLLGVSVQNAILIGAVLAATDAAAVFSVMRGMRISTRVRTLLEAEAGFNDAPVVVLVSVVASDAFGTTPWWQIPVIVIAELVGGALVGVGVGFGSRWLLPRLALPAVGLYPIAEIGLFFMLGALADVHSLPSAIPLAIVVAVLILVLARPLATLVSLLPFRMPWSTVAFTSIAGLRGAVPIVFAAIPLGLGVPGARFAFDVTLIVVLILLLVEVPLIRVAGRRLGVVRSDEAVELELESAPLDGMQAQVLGFEVPAGSGLIGTFVTEIGLPSGAVVSLVVRQGEAIAPDRNTRLRVGDQVLVVTTEDARAATEDRMRAVAARGRLARWLGSPDRA